MNYWFSSPGRSIVTAVVVASAFGVIVALIAWLEPKSTRHSPDDVSEGFSIEWDAKPDYALDPFGSGRLDPTTIVYKRLTSVPPL
jgi:hypothetical protein